MRGPVLSADGDEGAQASEDDPERDREPPPSGEHLAYGLAGVVRPAVEEHDDRGHIDRQVHIAVKAELVGDDERDQKADHHAEPEPFEMTSGRDSPRGAGSAADWWPDTS